jgi:predicted nucleotidyltransferase
MSPPPDEFAAIAAREFAQVLAASWAATLGDELAGIYLIGSLAHGGFSRRYSDIDLAVITESGLPATTLEQLRAEARRISDEFAPKVSIFWSNRAFSIGRFPPLDRIDYLDNAVTLVERTHVAPERPTLDEVRRYLAGAPFANWAASCERFAGSEVLDPKERKAYLRALLYPARFVFSWVTGRMVSNDEAVACLAEQAMKGLDVALVRHALACRQAAADPDPLFAARACLPGQASACAALIGSNPGYGSRRAP